MDIVTTEAQFASRFTGSGHERGRPRNPYNKDKCQWRPGATSEWFGAEPAIAALRPASRNQEDIRWYAYGLIMQFQVPVLRRVIEAVLVFDHGFKPKAITEALYKLEKHEYMGGRHIVCERVQLDGKVHKVYSFRRLATPAERDYLQNLCGSLNKALPNKAIGNAGEQYARGLLISSNQYCNITQKSRLGQVVDQNGENKLDLVAKDIQSGRTYGISVKNQREWIHSGHSAIKDCYNKAHAHGLLPWLIVSFADSSAIKRCERDGIRLTVLNRQIVPAEASDGRRMRNVLRELWSVIGPRPFEFLHARFDRTLKSSSATVADVAAIRSLTSSHEPSGASRASDTSLVHTAAATPNAEQLAPNMKRKRIPYLCRSPQKNGPYRKDAPLVTPPQEDGKLTSPEKRQIPRSLQDAQRIAALQSTFERSAHCQEMEAC